MTALEKRFMERALLLALQAAEDGEMASSRAIAEVMIFFFIII